MMDVSRIYFSNGTKKKAKINNSKNILELEKFGNVHFFPMAYWISHSSFTYFTGGKKYPYYVSKIWSSSFVLNLFRKFSTLHWIFWGITYFFSSSSC